MSPAEVLAAHQPTTLGDSCRCGAGYHDITIAAHQLDALVAAGYAVVELLNPDGPDEDGQLWFGDYDIRVDMTGSGPATAYLKKSVVSAAMLRQVAAEFLSAAAALDSSGVGVQEAHQ